MVIWIAATLSRFHNFASARLAKRRNSSSTTGYHTQAYDDLLKKADAESGDQALADYKKLSQMLIDDVVYIPLFYSRGSFLIKPYVKGAGTNNSVDYPWVGIQILQH